MLVSARLDWEPSCDSRALLYRLYGIEDDGQVVFVDSYEQGPFDTSLEVAQWAWRALAKQLPPSRC